MTFAPISQVGVTPPPPEPPPRWQFWEWLTPEQATVLRTLLLVVAVGALGYGAYLVLKGEKE
jgi:hypothetical protein